MTSDPLPVPGTRVEHRSLGVGTVRRVERGGRWLWVEFDATPALPFRVRGSEARGLEGGATDGRRSERGDAEADPKSGDAGSQAATGIADEDEHGGASQASAPGTAVEEARGTGDPAVELSTDPRHRASMLLEALRLGVVPRGGIRSYTVGRDAEIDGVLSMLDDDPGSSGRLRLVIGDYGTGKTHLLQCVRQQALERGFAVATATLDSRETTPAHPRRIYRALMHSLTMPSSGVAGGIGALFDALAARKHRPLPTSAPEAHRYLDPAYLYHAGLAGEPRLRDLLLDWIEGQPGELSRELNRTLRRKLVGAPKLLALPDYRTFGHVYAYLLGGVAHLCREAGAAGLCVLVDEAEYYAALSAENRAFADTVFGCYALASLSGDQVLRGEDDIRKGGQEVHRRIPLRFRDDQPLACAFALTPEPRGLASLGKWVDLDRHTVELPPLQSEHYQELVSRVQEVYEAAHPRFAVPDALFRPMGRFLYAAVAFGALPNPRALLKLLVEFFDLMRLTPHHLDAVMRDLARLFDRG